MKRILWLKPTKGAVSIGRMLIAENLREKGFNVKIFECSWFAIFNIFFKLLRVDFDVVIGTTHLGLAVGGLIKLLKGKPFIADFVDKYDVLFAGLDGIKKIFGYIIILLHKFSLRIADAVIVVPESVYEKFGQRRPNVYKTNLCINLEQFLKVDKHVIVEAEELLRNAGISLNKPIVVYVGGFGFVYNLDILLMAMKHLPDFQLIMIGGGPLEKQLKNLKEDLELNNVYFLGYLPNELVSGILKHCSVGVTLAEVPRQLKIYEYLAAGLSVVVSESVIGDDDFEFNEYCIPTELNPEKVAEKIRIAILRKTCGKIDRALIERLEKYDCRVVANLYFSILDKLVA